MRQPAEPAPPGMPPPTESAIDEQAGVAWAVGGTCPPQFWSCPGDAGKTRAALVAILPTVHAG